MMTRKTLLGVVMGLLVMAGCSSRGQGMTAVDARVAGTLEGPLGPDSASAHVLEAIERAERLHCYEIMSDTAHALCVKAIGAVDTLAPTVTEGYGIVVEKGAASTTFPNLRNSRCPRARYVERDSALWLSCSAMEGTGVTVERLYLIRFDANGKAFVAHTIDPFDVQQQLCERLGYRIEGDSVVLSDNGRDIACTAITTTDMGAPDSEQPLWVGEQMWYDLSGDTPRLMVTPGVKFTTGLVLVYDDMPTLAAPVALDEHGVLILGDLTEQPE